MLLPFGESVVCVPWGAEHWDCLVPVGLAFYMGSLWMVFQKRQPLNKDSKDMGSQHHAAVFRKGRRAARGGGRASSEVRFPKEMALVQRSRTAWLAPSGPLLCCVENRLQRGGCKQRPGRGSSDTPGRAQWRLGPWAAGRGEAGMDSGHI